MKKIAKLLLTSCAIACLAGCNKETDISVSSITIEEYPKTVFYCGEDFSNAGIVLKVTLSNGESFLTEDVTTKKIETMVPGSQTVNIYYTNDKYDIDTIIKYDIEVIDWTKEEKAIFSETSISSFAGVYYPKMPGMEIVVETDDEDGTVIDYYIKKENSSLSEIDEYIELLKKYNVTKKTSDGNGNVYDVTYKFYEQPKVPQDFRDNYDVNDAICYKYCASYIYLDQTTFAEYELYANEIEDTLVIGLSDEGDMIIRFIADSILLETMLSCEVTEHLDFGLLFNGTTLEYINQFILGYDELNDQGEPIHYLGNLEEIAPFAVDYFVLPSYEPDVVAISNYGSMYPWLHGEDDFCFELEVISDDVDEYENFVASLDSITEFDKTTKQDKFDGKDVNVTVYTIENMPYVGSLTIEVSDFIENGASYYQSQDSIRTKVEAGVYTVYYCFQSPEVISPALDEVYRIYDEFYGEGNYDLSSYDVYEKGEIGAIVKYSKDQVSTKEEALQMFVNDHLTGYTIKKAAENQQVSGYDLYTASYENEKFEILIYSYYSSNKYCIEFSVKVK